MAAQSPSGTRERRLRRRRWSGGPAPCRPPAGPPPAVSPTTQPPSTVAHRDQRVGRREVVGEPAAPSATVGRHRCGARALDRRPGATPRRGRAAGAGVAERVPGLDDGLPAGAAAEVGLEGPLHRRVVGDVGGLGPQGGEPDDDPRRAEAALAAAGGAQGLGPRRPDLGVEPVDGGDGPAGHPPDRGHARHPRRAVDQHRAAPALALRAAAVLGAADAQLVAQGPQQGAAVVGHLDRRRRRRSARRGSRAGWTTAATRRRP